MNYSFVNIEWRPNFIDFSSAIFVAHLGGGKSQEFCELNSSWLIVIELSQDLINELVVSLEAELFESSLEFLWINNSTEITIKDIESSLDISDFLDGDGHTGVIFCLPSFLFWGFGLRFSFWHRILRFLIKFNYTKFQLTKLKHHNIIFIQYYHYLISSLIFTQVY